MPAALTSMRARRTWARRICGSDDGIARSDPLELVEAVVEAVASAIEGSAPAAGPDWPEPPGGWADPWLPGAVHEQALSSADRSTRGAWYTPEPVVRGLVALAVAGRPAADLPLAVDPTCGGGAFLLAVLDHLVASGVEPGMAIERIAGMDIDPGAVQVSRWSLRLWAAANGLAIDGEGLDLSCGDALSAHPSHWPDAKLIVGNPPFATPLRTGAPPDGMAAYREANRDRLGPYADLAAMHLLAAVDRCGSGSTVALVQPQSVLSGRDTEALRVHCDEVAPLHGLWAAREAVFDAGVRACTPVLRPGAPPPGLVALASGPEVAVSGDVEPNRPHGIDGGWSRYAARALGAPALPAALAAPAPGPSAARLGDLVSATAGFRDEFYGLVDACREWDGAIGGEPNRLVTVGLVEPLTTGWGDAICRFGRRRWERPWIDVDALDGKVSSWTDRQLVPKVILATQSKVLEPVVDRAGTLIPATPLVALHAADDDLDLVAAVLLAPPVVAWAWQRWFGAALAVDALKLAASQVEQLPMPPDRKRWEEAAALIGSAVDDDEEPAAVALRVASTMNRAYGADDAVLEWWIGRAGRRKGRAGAAKAETPSMAGNHAG